MEQHYDDMSKALAEDMNEKNRSKDDGIKVGVFFCGPPVIGQQIADQCSTLSARARSEGRKIRYQFMIEVFG